MSDFKKYRSIENSYRAKFIQRFVEEYPELLTCEYILVEKCHGSNLSFYLSPNQPYKVGKRKSFLEEGTKFCGVWDVITDYTDVLESLQKYVDDTQQTVRLFGELYGPGIQKGVNYGNRKRIGFFDVMVDDVMLPPIEFFDFADEHGFIDDVLPMVGIVQGLQAALDYDTEFPTLINPVDDNICEGVVIKPYHKVYYDRLGRQFCLKKKNEKFMEKVSPPKPPRKEDPELTRLNLAFREYITDARVQSVFSKEGEIEEMSQIGQYIRLVIQDAKEDFLKDHDIQHLDKRERGKVLNVGGLVAKMLKGYLQ